MATTEIPVKPPIALVIGSGLTGPVIAMLLQKKGYTPIVFEKYTENADIGTTIALMPNGTKVLGVADPEMMKEVYHRSHLISAIYELNATGDVLGGNHDIVNYHAKFGGHPFGWQRTNFRFTLIERLAKRGIEFREGWALEKVVESETGVTAYFNEGRTAVGDFVVGCDGANSVVRRTIIEDIRGAKNPYAVYSGTTHWAGFSPIPEGWADQSWFRHIFAKGSHVVCYPFTNFSRPGAPTEFSWGVTLRVPEPSKKDWRTYAPDESARLIAEQLLPAVANADFPPHIIRMLRETTRLIKFGSYDLEEELKPAEWHSDRLVLMGDSAHPSGVSLGQGANMSLGDCYGLYELLPDLTTGANLAAQLTRLNKTLPAIFQKYAEKRQPITVALVKGARAQSLVRTALDWEARDERLKTRWETGEAKRRMEEINSEPFPGAVPPESA
ncbi:monooxygenase FAD-binding protein [Mycena olivaceomarginata]|nr:monooxygenase FAD-binding protein [Mycena olivaceomarginata]